MSKGTAEALSAEEEELGLLLAATQEPVDWQSIEDQASQNLRSLFEKQSGQKSFRRNPMSALIARHRVGTFRSYLEDMKKNGQASAIDELAIATKSPTTPIVSSTSLSAKPKPVAAKSTPATTPALTLKTPTTTEVPKVDRLKSSLTPEICELAELTVTHRKKRWINWEAVEASASEALKQYIDTQRTITPSYEKRRLNALLGEYRNEFDLLCAYLENPDAPSINDLPVEGGIEPGFHQTNGDRKSNDPSLPKELRELVNLVCRYSDAGVIRWDEIEETASEPLAEYIKVQRKNKNFDEIPIETIVGNTYLQAFNDLREIVEDCVTKIPPRKTPKPKTTELASKPGEKIPTEGEKEDPSKTSSANVLTPEMEELAKIVGPPGAVLPPWKDIKEKASADLLKVIEAKEKSTRIDTINGTATKIGFFVSGKSRALFNKVRGHFAGIDIGDEKTTKKAIVDEKKGKATKPKQNKARHDKSKQDMAKIEKTKQEKARLERAKQEKAIEEKAKQEKAKREKEMQDIPAEPTLFLDLTKAPEPEQTQNITSDGQMQENESQKRSPIASQTDIVNKRRRITAQSDKRSKDFFSGESEVMSAEEDEERNVSIASLISANVDKDTLAPEIRELAYLLEEVKAFGISKKQFDMPYILKHASSGLKTLIEDKRSKLGSFEKNALRSLVGERNEKRRRFDQLRFDIRPEIQARKEAESLFDKDQFQDAEEANAPVVESNGGSSPSESAHSENGLGLLAAALQLQIDEDTAKRSGQVSNVVRHIARPRGTQKLPHFLTQLAVLWQFSTPDLTHGPNWKFIEERAGSELLKLIQEKRTRKHLFKEDPVQLLVDLKYRAEFLAFRKRIQSDPDLFRGLLPKRVRKIQRRKKASTSNSKEVQENSGQQNENKSDSQNGPVIKHDLLMKGKKTWSASHDLFLSNEEQELACLIASARVNRQTWSFVENNASATLSALIREKSKMSSYFEAPTTCLVPAERITDFNAMISKLTSRIESENPNTVDDEANGDTEAWQLVLDQSEKMREFSSKLRNEICEFENSMLDKLRNYLK